MPLNLPEQIDEILRKKKRIKKKTLISKFFLLFKDLLSLTTDINVPTVSKKQKNLERKWHLENH